MKRVMATVALSGFLSVSTLAGQIPTDGSPAPTPTGTSQTTNVTTSGDIPSVGYLDYIQEAALSAFLPALGLASV
jgi:hypothetical protein